MKVPIPQDWDGEDWACVKIQWPNSQEYWGLLVGLLTLMHRGRFWDEDTGSIRDVQAVAWDIFTKNYPFTDCDNGQIDPPGDSVITCYASGGSDEDCDMGNCITNLEWGDDGKLYMYFGPCCRVAVEGDAGAIVQPPPDDPQIDPDDPSTWPCNKAAGIADSLFSVITDLQTAISGELSVYTMYTPANAVLSKFNVDWEDVRWICAGYIADRAAIDLLVGDSTTPQRWACLWANLLSPTDALDTTEVASMMTALRGYYSAGVAEFIIRVMNGLKTSTLSWWARLFHDNLGNCGCPEEPGQIVGPTAGGWYLDLPQTQTVLCDGGFNYTPAYFRELAPHDAYGVYFTYEHMDSNPTNGLKRHNSCNTPAPDTCFVQANSDSHAYGVDYMQCGDAAYAQLAPLLLNPQQDKTIPQWSDVVASPHAVAGDTIEFSLAGQRQGSEGEYVLVKFTMRWLRNINSPSHS